MLTEPEFSVEIPESFLVVSPGAIEIQGAVIPSLKHLKHYNTIENTYYRYNK